MTPLTRYASLLRSLPDKTVAHPQAPVLVSLSEHLGAPSGLSMDASSLVQWASERKLLSASAQWKLREVFQQWQKSPPKRSQVADFIDWLAGEVSPVAQ